MFRLLADTVMLAAALAAAFEIRFEGAVPPAYVRVFWTWLPAVLLIQTLACFGLGIHRLTWRFSGLLEARRILLAVSIPSFVLLTSRLTAKYFDLGWPIPSDRQLPVSVILMDMVFGFLALVGSRTAGRLLGDWQEGRRLRPRGGRRTPTLLIGAGRRGAAVARQLREQPDAGIWPLGFVDDDPLKQGSVIHGLRVLGSTAELSQIARRCGATQTMITLAPAAGADMLRIVEACEKAGLTAKIVPALHELMDGRKRLMPARDVTPADLLPRPIVEMSSQRLADLFRDRVVLVTGAGGSIGSELSRELAQFHPDCLVLLEQAENSLFHVHRRLAAEFPGQDLVPCVADICDVARVSQVFSRYRPAVVFHAAAHKHVPLMECNPGEAIKNNVFGSKSLADIAAANQVERFVMISTDKAVNPSSVMGASKRLAEIYVQALCQTSSCRFVVVRFGNVWASAGSVVPIFQEQIARGGPVTVTHPEMERYFMTIPEACQLVLQASGLGEGGEIFILDMGKPMRIVELARQMIRMAGFVPDVDVAIKFTGVRPGEKLSEELCLTEENTERTSHPRILKGRLQPYDWSVITRQLDELRGLAESGAVAELHAKLRDIIPEYRGDFAGRGAMAAPVADGCPPASLPTRTGECSIAVANLTAPALVPAVLKHSID